MADDPNNTYKFKLCGLVPGLKGAVAGVCERDGREEYGVLVPAPEGVPFPPDVEVVHSERLDSHTLQITTLYKPKGPSKVATPRYRSNYDAVFKPKAAKADPSWN